MGNLERRPQSLHNVQSKTLFNPLAKRKMIERSQENTLRPFQRHLTIVIGRAFADLTHAIATHSRGCDVTHGGDNKRRVAGCNFAGGQRSEEVFGAVVVGSA